MECKGLCPYHNGFKILSENELNSIELIQVIFSDSTGDFYLAESSHQTLLVKITSKDKLTTTIQSFAANSLDALGYWECPTSELGIIVLKYKQIFIPRLDLSSFKFDHLSDPYLVLSVNDKILNIDKFILQFHGNPYATIIVYNFYGLSVEPKTQTLLEMAEIGINYPHIYDIFMRKLLPEDSPDLLKTLIERGFIKFQSLEGVPVRLHPNVGDIINVLIPIPEEIANKYILDSDDVNSIIERQTIIDNFAKDGILIPAFAKDYTEYSNMNIPDTLDINLGLISETDIDHVSDINLFRIFGINIFYQNRKDLVKKIKIFIGEEAGDIVFIPKDKDLICVGNRSEYEIIDLEEIKTRIRDLSEYNYYDELIIEILATLAIYRPELRDQLSGLLKESISTRLSNKSFPKPPPSDENNIWKNVKDLPNYINIRKIYVNVEDEDIFSNFTLTIKQKDSNLHISGNVIESIIRDYITENFKIDPTIIREYTDDGMEFDITIGIEIDTDKLRTALEETIRHNFKTKYDEALSTKIVTHMIYNLENHVDIAENFITSFMHSQLDRLVGEQNYDLDVKTLEDNVNTRKIEYTITLYVTLDKKRLKAAIRKAASSPAHQKAYEEYIAKHEHNIVSLPIVTHMKYTLIEPLELSEKFTTLFISEALNKMLGLNQFKLDSKHINPKEIEYTITTNKNIDKRDLKQKIRNMIIDPKTKIVNPDYIKGYNDFIASKKKQYTPIKKDQPLPITKSARHPKADIILPELKVTDILP